MAKMTAIALAAALVLGATACADASSPEVPAASQAPSVDVTEQSPAPGDPVEPGATMSLEFDD